MDPFAGSGTTAATAHKLGRRWVTVERERATIDEFIIPRLDQVIAGTDHGGISTIPNNDVAGLPPAFSSRQARLASQWVQQLAKDGTFGEDQAAAERIAQALREASKTDARIQQWHGGGSYRVITRTI